MVKYIVCNHRQRLRSQYHGLSHWTPVKYQGLSHWIILNKFIFLQFKLPSICWKSFKLADHLVKAFLEFFLFPFTFIQKLNGVLIALLDNKAIHNPFSLCTATIAETMEQ